MTLGPTAT